jgi:hypothetical protein
MKYIFVIYLFGVIDNVTLYYKIGQIYDSLTLSDSRIYFILGRR